MKNNKLLTVLLVILVSITLVGVIALVMILNTDGSKAANGKSIDDIVKASVEIPEITTNLANNDFIKISFMVETDSKKGKEELEKRMFQVNNIIIEELSEFSAEQFEGKQGKVNLQDKLKKRINGIMQDGTIEHVYITSSIIQ
ncbi:MAG: flagellar basal body-associated protein FliL [Bacillus sp. (in: firmicutes)]